jgi:predicted DNA-binding transcriptional regulator AlpA
MSTELLPKVDLWQVSSAARQVLTDLVNEAVRKALEEHGLKRSRTPAVALRGTDAAAYIGVGRSRFYGLLKEHPELMAASYTVGKARCWPVAALDAWMQARQAEAAA